MLVVSFVRHGESLDNLKSIWAGHKDAELSELGVRQAKALGGSYVDTRLDAIITSDLKRAYATAAALLDGQPDPKPSFIVDRNIREQNFGDGEGHSWQAHRVPNKSLPDHFRDGQYPILFNRNEKFPNGESVNDLAARAELFIHDRILKAYLPRTISQDGRDVHIAVVSHGLCIGEMIQALMKWNDGDVPVKDYRGLSNTAWTRVTVQVKPGIELPQTTEELQNIPPLVITVTDVNRHEHTTNIKRREGVVEDDPVKQKLREFFGGNKKELVEALEHTESDAIDEKGKEERD